MTATDQAVRHWERVFAQQPKGGPAWLATLRADAFATFQAEGFPRPRSAGWRHTSLAPLSRVAFERERARAGTFDGSTLPTLADAAVRAVFVDGALRPELSRVDAPGVTLRALADALGDDDDLRASLRAEASGLNGALVPLNAALLEDGAVIDVARGAVVAGPIHLIFASTATPSPTVTTLRNLIRVGANAEAKIVEHYVSANDDTAFTNVVTDVRCGEGAHVTHVRVQDEGDEAWHVADVRATVARDATFTSASVALGAKLSRTAIQVMLDGEGASCDLLGLYLGRGAQHHDHQTRVDHLAPHGTSSETYKGVLDDQARGVFTGYVHVAPDAQKTNAAQSNRNLLLSNGAHADSEPMLEIHADDVKCSHGSAIGRLDEDALFYLRARGIDHDQARRLLVHAFAMDVLDKLSVPALRAWLEARLEAWLQASSERAS